MSNTNSYIVLTEQGLSAVATQPWPQISLKYFLPMYDERIDKLIHTDAGLTSAVPLSASVTSADSQASLVGERIYNIPSTSGIYQLTTNNVASSGFGASFNGVDTILASTVNKAHKRTSLNGKTLAPTVSGNVEPIYDVGLGQLSFVGGSAIAPNVNSWTIDESHIKRENLFDAVSFNPSQVSSGSYNVVSGLFKFTLQNVVGSYRFNKIAFFIQPMNVDGSINDTYDPILFGQAVVDTSQIIEVGGQGSQTFEVTIQLAFTIKDSMVVLTNNDYWSMVPTSASTRNQNGLFFAGDVALGTSSIPNSWQPRAKMHITDDTDAPQVRLSHSNGLSGLNITMTDNLTSGMVAFSPTSGFAKGFGFTFGTHDCYAVAGTENRAAFAFGDATYAVGIDTLAFGTGSSAIGDYAMSFGILNKVVTTSPPTPIAMGTSNLVSATDISEVNIALGYGNSSYGGVAMGSNCITSGYAAQAFGVNCKALNTFTIGIGSNNFLYSVFSFAHGFNNTVSGAGTYNGAIGYNNLINNDGRSKNWVIGADNISLSGVNSVIFGNGNIGNNVGISPIMVGNFNSSNGGGILFGNNNTGPGQVFGSWSYSYFGSFAAGTSARAGAASSIAIGNRAFAGYADALSPLPNLYAASYNVAIGESANIDDQASYSVSIGSDSQVASISGYGVSVGDTAFSTFKSIALGAWSKAYGIECVALGFKAKTYLTDDYSGVEGSGVDDFNFKGSIAIGSYSKAWNSNYGIAIGHYAEAKPNTIGFSMPATSVGSFVSTSPQSIGGNVYSMTTVGYGLSNEYAGFMAGIASLTTAEMVGLFGAVSSWNFIPLVVLGAGEENGGDRRNGLQIGRLKNNETSDKTIIVMDLDNTPSASYSDTVPAGSIRYNAPKGTIFKGAHNNYGLATLYVYNPADDVYRA